MIAGPRRRGIGGICAGGSCGVGIGSSIDGKSIHSLSSSSIFARVEIFVLVLDGRESAERDRAVSLRSRIDEAESSPRVNAERSRESARF